MVTSLPDPDPAADVRLWVDRCFTVQRRRHRRHRHPARRAPCDAATALACGRRRCCGSAGCRRSGATASRSAGSPGWPSTSAATHRRAHARQRARHAGCVAPHRRRRRPAGAVRASRPTAPVLHVGAADLPVRFRPLGGRPGPAHAAATRCRCASATGRCCATPADASVWRVDVLDPDPPRLRRRGAAARRAEQLAGADGTPSLADELRRRGVAHADRLRQLGVPGGRATASRPARGWSTPTWRVPCRSGSPTWWPSTPATTRSTRPAAVRPGRRACGCPRPSWSRALVRPPLRVVDGRVLGAASTGLPRRRTPCGGRGPARTWPTRPFAAPTADRLRELGLDERALGAAERGRAAAAGGAGHRAARPASVGRSGRPARATWTSRSRRARPASGWAPRRRVVLPLLDHLDRAGRTRRLPDDRREVVDRA